MERAIDTQRLKLLRLLAGLAIALGFVSAAPIAPAWSRWVRSVVFSVLNRLESAAQSLVLAQACIEAKTRGEAVDWARLSRPPCDDGTLSADHEPPSLEVLRHRMRALQRVLEDLPRQGRRLLRQSIKRIAEMSVALPDWCIASHARPVGDSFRASQWRAPGLWHPPEHVTGRSSRSFETAVNSLR